MKTLFVLWKLSAIMSVVSLIYFLACLTIEMFYAPFPFLKSMSLFLPVYAVSYASFAILSAVVAICGISVKDLSGR